MECIYVCVVSLAKDLTGSYTSRRICSWLSITCILCGILWLFLLPLDRVSRRTYISENALLPGQVYTYFGGSDHNVFRAYRHEIDEIVHDNSSESRCQRLADLFNTLHLKFATQSFRYPLNVDQINQSSDLGCNTYAILHGPHADPTEAMVLIAALKNVDGMINYSGVALVYALARYFKNWNLWAKEIILLITEDSFVAPQAWIDAYHDNHDPRLVDPLSLRSGALQGAVAVDYAAGPAGQRFDKLHVLYEGLNGQLPNLDLFNTLAHIANGQMGMDIAIENMMLHDNSGWHRLEVVLRRMLRQSLGHATGPHSAFIPYRIDALTVQTVGTDGLHNEMTLGRTLESLFRSINNLLEHLHQSFFFYMLLNVDRFVSIGTYLPSAMLLAANFTIMALGLWVERKSYRERPPGTGSENSTNVFFAIAILCGIYSIGLVPIILVYTLNQLSVERFVKAFIVLTPLAPPLFLAGLKCVLTITEYKLVTVHCFALLCHGLLLSTLATLNFSLAFFIGVLTSPLSFVHGHTRQCLVKVQAKSQSASSTSKFHFSAPLISYIALNLLSPSFALYISSFVYPLPANPGFSGILYILNQCKIGWKVHGLWTPLSIWLIWWPAWLTSCLLQLDSVLFT